MRRDHSGRSIRARAAPLASGPARSSRGESGAPKQKRQADRPAATPHHLPMFRAIAPRASSAIWLSNAALASNRHSNNGEALHQPAAGAAGEIYGRSGARREVSVSERPAAGGGIPLTCKNVRRRLSMGLPYKNNRSAAGIGAYRSGSVRWRRRVPRCPSFRGWPGGGA